MDQEEPSSNDRSQARTPKTVIGLFVGFVVSLLLYLFLGLLDNSTELTPNHDDMLIVAFFVATVIAGISGVLGWYSVREETAWRQIGTVIPVLLVGFLLGFMIFGRAAEIVEGLIDFPSAKTQSRQGLLVISRAYQNHGKGRDWHIQTTPIWSDLEITEDDYKFMLSRRRPGDTKRDPDEISSRGYFCASVTLQQSGDALRVMNAGSRKLPKGTVIVCPPHEERQTR